MMDDPMACWAALEVAGMTIPVVGAFAFAMGLALGSRR